QDASADHRRQEQERSTHLPPFILEGHGWGECCEQRQCYSPARQEYCSGDAFYPPASKLITEGSSGACLPREEESGQLWFGKTGKGNRKTSWKAGHRLVGRRVLLRCGDHPELPTHRPRPSSRPRPLVADRRLACGHGWN